MNNQIPEAVKERAAEKASFVKSVIKAAILLIILLFINLWTSSDYFWVGWVALFIGIGLLFRGIKLFSGFDSLESRLQEHFEKKEMEKHIRK